MANIKLLGSLLNVTLTSKLDSNDRPVHTVALKIELAEGHEQAHDIAEHLKEMVELDIIPRQPKLK
jgi:hypothetical protein